MAPEYRLVPCLTDNYAVLLHDSASGETAVIDAPEAAPVVTALEKEGWRPRQVLITHHHGDHTAGIPVLIERYGAEVVVPAAEAARIPGAGPTVREGDEVQVGNLRGRVIETPGHTRGHVSYYFEADGLLFAADTLFSLGCGRLLEDSAEAMWHSLEKLRRLPDDTLVFCGHEYTASNARFALSVDPDNPALKKRAAEVEALRAEGRPTIPSRLGEEKAVNPFLRADDPKLAAAVGLSGARPEEVFAELRRRKDHF
jgi:hydroxyacylglutathione hydrolase